MSQQPLLPARHKPHPLTTSTQTIKQEKTKNPEKRLNPQQFLLYYLGLCTQNTVLREVDLEQRLKRGSDKINMLRHGKKNRTKNKSYRTAWTHKGESCT